MTKLGRWRGPASSEIGASRALSPVRGGLRAKMEKKEERGPARARDQGFRGFYSPQFH